MNKIKCKKCGWDKNINKDVSVNKIDIGETMKKLKVDPEHIYQEVVTEKGIKANNKYIGKIATVIIDKKNIDGMTDKEGKKLSDAWEKGSI